MTKAKIFNRGLASGEAFCNRVQELERVIKNIHGITHTLLISPRRYGKTSLALRAIESTKLPYAYIDLFMKYDAESVMDEFFTGIGNILSQIIKPTEIAIRKLEGLLKNLTVSLRLGKLGFEFTLAPRTADGKKNLKALLVDVDEILAKNNKHAVIFIDEMQAISETSVSAEVEASLRFVAQKTSHISFIFSGSSRHLLSKMFDDRSRPLYMLCHKMSIQRIAAEHYKSFINKFAKLEWQQFLADEVIEEICFRTQLHPYYINILCAYLFECEHVPTPEDVVKCWKKICREEQGSIAKDIEFLTPKQKQLLSEIANCVGLKEPTAKEFVRKVDLTPKGVAGALKILLKHDLVERLETNEIRIIDPVLDYWSKL